MNRGWKKIKLGDICEFKYGKGLPKRKRTVGDFPVYGSGGIIDYHKDYLVEGPGIIIGRKGTIGSIFYEKRNFYPIDTVFYIEKNSDIYNIKFLYYLFLTINLDKLNSDAAVPGLNRNIAYQQEVLIPPLNIQHKIVSILSAYDDLIENNTRRIKILEEMAQSIYREWFVKFRFPGHEKVKMIKSEIGMIPEGWEVKRLGEVTELSYGKALKKSDRKIGPYPVYGSSGIVGYHSEYLVQGPGIIVGRKGNVGSVFWSQQNFYPIDTVYFVKSNINLYYVFFNLKEQSFINNDAAVPGLNRNQAYLNRFLLPSNEILLQFSKIISPIFNKIGNLQLQIENLRKTRDLLLPKLISGEIDVESLNIKERKI